MSKFKDYIELQKMYNELGEKLNKAQADFERTIPLQKLRKIYYFVDSENKIREAKWSGSPSDLRRYSVGSVFETIEEAEKEQLKRVAVGKIERFRNECNGNWQPDWNNLEEDKYTIVNDGEYFCIHETEIDMFNMFGYFKHKSDCNKAIELFFDDLEKWLNYETK